MTETIIGICSQCGGQVADACDVIGYRRERPTCLGCGAQATEPTTVTLMFRVPVVHMGEPPKHEVWVEDIWRLGHTQ